MTAAKISQAREALAEGVARKQDCAHDDAHAMRDTCSACSDRYWVLGGRCLARHRPHLDGDALPCVSLLPALRLHLWRPVVTSILRTCPAVGLYGLLAGVSWHAVTLAVDTFHGLSQAL